MKLLTSFCFLICTLFCAVSCGDVFEHENEIPVIPTKFKDNYFDYKDDGHISKVEDFKQDPDFGLQTPDLIKSRGFKEETHYVTTLDGYILSMHRIVNQKVSGDNAKGPVIINHGLGGSSIDFVFNSPGGHIDENLDTVGNNLGFELAKRGYDVWLANSRGNLYSVNHTKVDPKEREFWDFSFQEMIEYDVPAVIAYVQARTNSSTVGWIGHSQGTMIMFGLLSERPEYAQVVKPFIALAPVATLGYIKSPVRYLAQDFLLKLLEARGGSLLPDGLIRRLFSSICALEYIHIPQACESLAFLFAGGMDYSQINTTRLPIYLRDESYGTSGKNIAHFGQNVISKRFMKYNYGEKKNMERYGVPQAPEYVLERITSKNIILMSGLADKLADPIDLKILRSRLTVPLAEDYVVPDKGWGHLEFAVGKDAGKFVNEPILRYLEKYM